MKSILLWASLCPILSCSSTSSKKDAILAKIESIEKGPAEKYSRFIIDSVRYSAGNLQGYYTEMINSDKYFINSNIEMLSTCRFLHDNKNIVELSNSIMEKYNRYYFLVDLLNKLPVDKEVYSIDYFLDYQSDVDNFKGHKTAYLYVTDLNEVFINTDSIYKHSASYKQHDYDSAAEVNALNDNDILERRAKELQKQLEFKIARGTNQETILNYKEQIINTEAKINNNMQHYPVLFMY